MFSLNFKFGINCMKAQSNFPEFFGGFRTYWVNLKTISWVCRSLMCCVLSLSLSQGGCIYKLENFILEHLLILGGVGIGIAFLQVRNPLFPIIYALLLLFIYSILILCFLFSFEDFWNALYLLSVSKFKRGALLRPCILYLNTKNTFTVLKFYFCIYLPVVLRCRVNILCKVVDSSL